MVGKKVSSGNRGKTVRGDCYVTLEITDDGGLDICLDSKVSALYGEKILTVGRELLQHFGIRHARLTIEDFGAFDFVLAARIEAAARQLIPDLSPYLPEFIDENCYSTTADRMRFSRLYLPGNSPKMMINAGIYGAHGVILDLEDSVAPTKKDEALLLVRNALRQVDFYGAERMVRINQLPRGLDDLKELVAHNVHLILLPKCESGDQIRQVNDKIYELQQQEGLTDTIYLMPIIESALGVIKAYEIASAAKNVVAVALGLEDYCADLGVKRTVESRESLYAKSSLVNACHAAGVQPIDSVFSDFQDMDGLLSTVQQAKSIGFQGIGCIHPAQVKIANETFLPSSEDISSAKKIVLCFEDAEKKGLGVVSLGSKMIDPPVVERSIQTINRAISSGIILKDWRLENE